MCIGKVLNDVSLKQLPDVTPMLVFQSGPFCVFFRFLQIDSEYANRLLANAHNLNTSQGSKPRGLVRQLSLNEMFPEPNYIVSLSDILKCSRGIQSQLPLIYVVFAGKKSPVLFLPTQTMSQETLHEWYYYLTRHLRAPMLPMTMEDLLNCARAWLYKRRRDFSWRKKRGARALPIKMPSAEPPSTDLWEIALIQSLSKYSVTRACGLATANRVLELLPESINPNQWQFLKWLSALMECEDMKLPTCFYSTRVEKLLLSAMESNQVISGEREKRVLTVVAAHLLLDYPFLLLPGTALQSRKEWSENILPLLSTHRVCVQPPTFDEGDGDWRQKVLFSDMKTRVYLKDECLFITFEDLERAEMYFSTYSQGPPSKSSDCLEGCVQNPDSADAIQGRPCILQAIELLSVLCSLSLIRSPTIEHLLILAYLAQIMNFDSPIALRAAASFLILVHRKHKSDWSRGFLKHTILEVQRLFPLSYEHWNKVGFDIWVHLRAWRESLFLSSIPVVAIGTLWDNIFARVNQSSNQAYMSTKIHQLLFIITNADNNFFYDVSELNDIFGPSYPWFKWTDECIRSWIES
eukprot:Blabericola_migrator_1__10414@NODE_588_length_7453_cov_88_141348_g435_i0_p2_GENE_NODE_588_length_7453_cov_88_141348_g435_i0NODE_588_length_7453_cov_88_141348_g435_i0_p2_ORF_typecomplete_len578_score47_08_NODE_588_length_7453_cov_88_141348_g435_i022483981